MADASLSNAPSNLLCEVVFHGVPLLGLTAVSSYVVIRHFMGWRENYGKVRMVETLYTLLKSPPVLGHERGASERALEEQSENLWKAAFIFLAALCSRTLRLRRKTPVPSWKEVLSDGTLRLLFAAFLFLASSWVFHQVGQ
jgi:hypothetical protein